MNCRECGGTEFELFNRGGFICKVCKTPLHLTEVKKTPIKEYKVSYEKVQDMTWETNSTVRDMECTIVITPHFKKRWEKRFPQISKDTIITMCKTIIRLSNHDQLNGSPVRDLDGQIIGYVYTRKKFNLRRKQWELEMVSVTPAKVFQTHNTEEEVEWLEAE